MATAGYSYRFNESTSAIVSYAFQSREFDEEFENGFKDNNFSVGLLHWFNEDFSASASAGFFRHEPDFGSTDEGLSWSVGITQRFETIMATLAAGYYPQNLDPATVGDGYSLQDRQGTVIERKFNGSLNVTKAFEYSTLNIAVDTGYDWQYFEAENLGFNRYSRISAGWNYAPLEDLQIRLSGFYRENKYEETVVPRKDATWQGDISLSYHILEWLTGSLNYHYRQLDSTNDFEDYTENRVLLTFTIPYEGKPVELW